MKYQSVLAVGLVCACLTAPVLAQDQNEVCIPQFVAGTSEGYRWETTLMFFNQGETDVTSQWNFFNATGQPVGGTFRERLGQGDPTTIDATGQFSPTPFTAGTARSFRFSSEEALQPGFVVMTSDAALTTHARLHLFDANGNLISESTVIPGSSFQNGAFFVDATDAQLTGFAIANTSATESVNCTMQLFREGDVNQVGQDVTLTLAPRNQVSQLVQETFAASFLNSEPGYVVMSCDQPVCALAMQVRGVTATQIPIAATPLTPATP